MSSSGARDGAAVRWTMRLIPALIVCTIGLATYAISVRLCVQYLYRTLHSKAAGVILLLLYCLLLLLTLGSYVRVFLAIQRDPGLVPLVRDGRRSETVQRAEKRRGCPPGRRHRDTENAPPSVPPDPDPDPDPDPSSPGLEPFYGRDVFVCGPDGRPRWCSGCLHWKPDRAHHSRELGRCVRKMDHLCPWVGGMVSETSFNFFTHFTFYATCLCALSLAVSIYGLAGQLNAPDVMVDGWVIAMVALSAFFFLFALGMTLTAGRYIFTNTTNIDMLRKRKMFILAVRIPLDTPPSPKYPTTTYPLPSDRPFPLPSMADARVPGDPGDDPKAARDQRRLRKFAILIAEPGENPFDLGLWENWRSVMGNSVAEWLLPLRHSPCCHHEGVVSEYPFGALVDELRRRYGVPDLDGKVPPEEAALREV